jgi:alkylation response protein AidB-like acyl-CoA dehydrogenase
MTVARRAVAPRYSAPHVPRDDASEPFMLQLSDKGADYLNRVRELGPMVDAAADQIDAGRDLPPSLFAALRELGLFRLVQPAEYGGAELDSRARRWHNFTGLLAARRSSTAGRSSDGSATSTP